MLLNKDRSWLSWRSVAGQANGRLTFDLRSWGLLCFTTQWTSVLTGLANLGIARYRDMSTLPAGYISKHKVTSASSRPSVDCRLDDSAFGTGTFLWQDPVHSWKAGPGAVMIVEIWKSWKKIHWLFGRFYSVQQCYPLCYWYSDIFGVNINQRKKYQWNCENLKGCLLPLFGPNFKSSWTEANAFCFNEQSNRSYAKSWKTQES